MFGNVIGDSLGCPTEFSNVRYNSNEVMRHNSIYASFFAISLTFSGEGVRP